MANASTVSGMTYCRMLRRHDVEREDDPDEDQEREARLRASSPEDEQHEQDGRRERQRLDPARLPRPAPLRIVDSKTLEPAPEERGKAACRARAARSGPRAHTARCPTWNARPDQAGTSRRRRNTSTRAAFFAHPGTSRHTLPIVSVTKLAALRRPLAEQPLRAEHEDDDQDPEDDRRRPRGARARSTRAPR